MSGRSVLLLLIARLRGRSGWKRWCRPWHHRRRVWFRRERHGPLLELCDHSDREVEADLCGEMSCPTSCIGVIESVGQRCAKRDISSLAKVGGLIKLRHHHPPNALSSSTLYILYSLSYTLSPSHIPHTTATVCQYQQSPPVQVSREAQSLERTLR